MLFNFKKGIFCFYCNKYYNQHTEVYLNVLYEGSISCNENHLIGNQWDIEWIKYWGIKDENN